MDGHEELARRIGHTFSTNSYLKRALTHSSFRPSGKRHTANNERLEFLGDRVLGLVIAEWLFIQYPKQDEGELAPKLNALVRKETCAKASVDIELGRFLKLGRGEESAGGRDKMAVLGNAMEALIAAVYLDGGYDAARDMILRVWHPYMESVQEVRKDPKTALQEWAQGRGLPSPEYVEVERKGPDHEPEFVMAVNVQGLDREVAKGASKRIAEQNAAKALLKREDLL